MTKQRASSASGTPDRISSPTPASELRVLQVGQVLLSPDLLTCCFCCDLEACGGACCVEGESGAPLTLDEACELEQVLPAVEADLGDEARAVISRQGVAYVDGDGDLVTSIVGGKDCVFTCYDEAGCCLCATEKAFREGRTRWCKPVSCALYPIRERKLSNGYVGLNYHRWSVCAKAVERGNELGLPIYKFLREPLIRRFGEAWYGELERTVDELRHQGLLP